MVTKAVLTGRDTYCGTCEYWQGCRSIEYYGSQVEIKDSSERAKCKVPSTGFIWGPNNYNHYRCQYYKKWGALE